MGKNNMTPELVSKIKEMKEKENLSIRGIRDELLKKINNITFHDVRNTLNGLYDTLTENENEIVDVLSEIDSDFVKEKAYDIVWEDYILHAKNKSYKLSIEIIDKMFKDFSRHWNNLSGEDMLRKYKIKPEVWQLIKRTLRLYKASDVVSPYTMETLPEEQTNKIIEEAIDENISNTKEKMLNTYEKQYAKECKKALKIAGNFEYQLDLYKKAIENYSPKEIIFEPIERINTKSADFIVTDLHLWKNNTDAIVESLSLIKQHAIDHEAQNINIICLWDIGENFSQTPMHSGQHINCDVQNPHSLKLYIADIFEDFLIDIRNANKQVRFVGLTWNHDRHTQKREDDILGTAGLDIYEFMKRGLKNLEIEIDYFTETINQLTTETRHYILSHWEFGFNKKKPSDLLWQYGDKEKFNVILSWHTHWHKQEVGKNFAKLVVSPLAWEWDYDKRLGLQWETWYTVVEDSTFWGGIRIVNEIIRLEDKNDTV